MGENQVYELTVALDPDTVQWLHAAGHNLLGLMASQAFARDGVPLLGFVVQEFMEVNKIQLSHQWKAYTASGSLTPGARITADSSVEISTGQTWEVQSDGSGPVINPGTTGAITILNTAALEWVCGIGFKGESDLIPINAFPLYGREVVIIEPVAKVLLMFSELPLTPSTVLLQAVSPGVIIDFTANNQRTVNFDLSDGWTWDEYSWAQPVPLNADLIPLLLPPPNGAV